LLQLIEGGRWILTLTGMVREWPPTDPDGFLGFTRTLHFPDIYDAIRDAEPSVIRFRFATRQTPDTTTSG
jgi:hypothetical protein